MGYLENCMREGRVYAYTASLQRLLFRVRDSQTFLKGIEELNQFQKSCFTDKMKRIVVVLF